MKLDLMNNLINITKENDFVQNFIKELTNFLENNHETKIPKESQRYSNYWGDTNFMEDGISATIGLSRWATVSTYRDELSKAVDDSILKLSEQEGTLYRKQFMENGPTYNSYFWVDKYENGKIEHLKIAGKTIPGKFKNQDIIFQYKKDGSVRVRPDLKDKTIKLASEKCENLKQKENEKSKNYKKEGHIYKAIEDDGYIFLKDLTEDGNLIEDIDFVVDSYDGDGKYQVIDGEYKLVDN